MKIINSSEKNGIFAPKTKQNTINRITNAKKKISNKEEKNNALEESKQQRKIDANALRQKYGNTSVNAKPIINKFEKYKECSPAETKIYPNSQQVDYSVVHLGLRLGESLAYVARTFSYPRC